MSGNMNQGGIRWSGWGRRWRRAMAAVLLVWLGLGVAWGQGIPIERAQREFQARYYLIHHVHVTWPASPCEPAPPYPPDGFYGAEAATPQLAAKLVADLADKFYGNTIIYPLFVASPDGIENIEGQTTIPTYDEDDFEALDDSITVSNYEVNFGRLSRAILKLKFLPFQAHPTAPTGSNPADTPDWKQSEAYADDYESARVAASAAWSSASWEPYGAWAIGVVEATDVADRYRAILTAWRGRIYANLQDAAQIVSGPDTPVDLSGYRAWARVYLKVGAGADGVGPYSNGCPVSADGKFHGYTNPTLPVEYWSDPIVAADVVPQFSDEPPDYGTGWNIADQTVIVGPNFSAYAHDQANGVEGGGCADCGFGETRILGDGAHMRIGLGLTAEGKSAGWLGFHRAAPGPALFTAEALVWAADSDVAVYTDQSAA